MRRMVLTTFDNEFNSYHWHPLFDYVDRIKTVYGLAVYRAYRNGSIDEFTKDEYLYGSGSYDFSHMLEFLNNCYNGIYITCYENHEPLKLLLDIFKPLDVTCYNGLALFKYKSYIALDDMDMFGQDFWTLHHGLYRECRSVVFDIKEGKIVLAPQPKFHNVNENEDWSIENIRGRIKKAKKVEITNKLDGSNQNYRWYNGEIVGSGSSALNPAESWRLTEGYKLLTNGHKKMMEDYPDWTFMFEYISPKNIIVVNYTQEEEGLYLFGARNVYSGEQKTYEEVLSIGKHYNVPCTDIYDDSFEDIMTKLDDYKSDDKEGWVIGIQSSDGNIFKAKLKVNDYVLMHKALTKMISPNAIIKAIAEDCYDDFYSKIPVAYRGLADDISKVVYNYLYTMAFEVGYYLTKAKENSNDTKSFMIYCDKEIPKKYNGYVKAKYLGREINFLKKNGLGYKKLNELT